ncbi:MAG: YfhO family protein [Candidatus Hydrogenedentes bacterium]|nr:YfhO family protein [Candidatus Hydrogenedentota bacterium]
MSRSRIENALCVALLAAIALIALYPAIMGRKVPVDVAALLSLPPWEEARPDTLSEPSPANAEALRYYPWYVFLADSARHSELPLWDSLEGCGTPFFALWKTRCLSPFSAPFYLLAPEKALGFSFLLKMLVAGLAAFYTARRLGFAPPLAFMAGAAFELSGHIFGSLLLPPSDVLPWFPLLLLITERLALGQARYWPGGAIVLALMLLGGSPETAIVLVTFAALYLALRMYFERSKGVQMGLSFVAFAVVVVAALGLAAIQIIPFTEYTKQADPALLYGMGAPLGIADAVSCFLPQFFGKAPAEVGRASGAIPALSLTLMHVGLVQFLFVPLWFSLRRFVVAQQRRRIEAMLIAAFLLTCLALFGAKGLSPLPFLGRVTPDLLLAANALVLAYLAVAAADEWLALDPDEAHTTVVRMCVFLPALLVFGAVVLWWSHSQPRLTAPPLKSQLLIAAGFLTAYLVVLAATLLRPSHALMGYGLGVATALQLFFAFHANLSFQDPAQVFPETPFIQSLKEGGSRISGSAALGRWPLAGNLVPQVFSSGALLNRQAQFFGKLRHDPLLLRRTGAPALLLTKEDIQGAFASVRPNLKVRRVFASGAILFDDLEMKPRAWMTYEARNTDKFDPALLDSSQPPLVEAALSAMTPPARPANATVTESTNSRVRVHVEDTPPGLLVLSDTWYPGWRATVDGTLTNVVAVDGLFRGVALPKGPHDVEFFYSSPRLRAGAYMTAVSLVLVAAACLRLLLRRAR